MSGVLKTRTKAAWEAHVYGHLNAREPEYHDDCEGCYNMLASGYSAYVAGLARHNRLLQHRIIAHQRLEAIARGIGMGHAAAFAS